jgi:hypothetical protein
MTFGGILPPFQGLPDLFISFLLVPLPENWYDMDKSGG